MHISVKIRVNPWRFFAAQMPARRLSLNVQASNLLEKSQAVSEPDSASHFRSEVFDEKQVVSIEPVADIEHRRGKYMHQADAYQCEETEIAFEPDVAKNIYVWKEPKD